jgi:hypothetical protein
MKWIAVDHESNRYYDHSLTEIEKGKLLDEESRIKRPVRSEEASSILSEFLNSGIISGRKDIRLISILQKLSFAVQFYTNKSVCFCCHIFNFLTENFRQKYEIKIS